MRANSTEHMTVYRAPNEVHDTLVGVASNGELVEGMATLETTSHPEHIARDALGVTVSPGPSSCACDGEGTCKEFVEQ